MHSFAGHTQMPAFGRTDVRKDLQVQNRRLRAPGAQNAISLREIPWFLKCVIDVKFLPPAYFYHKF
jgi:hypothetical protein